MVFNIVTEFATVITIQFLEHFYHLRKRLHTHEQSLPLTQPLGNNQSTFYLYKFACSGYFTSIESYIMWSFVTHFFHFSIMFSRSIQSFKISNCLPISELFVFLFLNPPKWWPEIFSQGMELGGK